MNSFTALRNLGSRWASFKFVQNSSFLVSDFISSPFPRFFELPVSLQDSASHVSLYSVGKFYRIFSSGFHITHNQHIYSKYKKAYYGRCSLGMKNSKSRLRSRFADKFIDRLHILGVFHVLFNIIPNIFLSHIPHRFPFNFRIFKTLFEVPG